MVLCTASFGGGALLTSCADTWDDHYHVGQEAGIGTKTIYELIKENPDLSEFCDLLEHTHLYNNMRSTKVTYADLLNGSQALTVWAPVNGTFDYEGMKSQCGTAKGDSIVGQHFSANHISRNIYSLDENTEKNVLMFNNKFMDFTGETFHNSNIDMKRRNMAAKNGLLNVIDEPANYAYNVYEAITSLDRFKFVGDFFRHFDKYKLNEDASVPAGIVDGQKVYSDSVMYIENQMFNFFDWINEEDSNFVMMLPDPETWNNVIEEATPYFNYGSIIGADSIQNYWMNARILSDLIYNRAQQHADSIFTIRYNRYKDDPWPFHVFKDVRSAGGYLDMANIADSVECSNGAIMVYREWPFKKEDLYFKRVKCEAEDNVNVDDYSEKEIKTWESRYGASVDSVSEGAYRYFVAKNASSKWKVTYKVFNTLAGTYDISVVLLPKTVMNAFSKDKKTCKFTATITYTNEDGTETTVDCGETFTNDPEHVDTIKLARITLPVCNYMQDRKETVRIELSNAVKNAEMGKFSAEMLLDCFYLRPVPDEELYPHANVRKED